MMTVFFFIAHEKGLQIHVQPPTDMRRILVFGKKHQKAQNQYCLAPYYTSTAYK